MSKSDTRDSMVHKEAITLIRGGSYDEALELLERLEATADVLNDRAVALFQTGREEEAVRALDRALETEPDNIPAMLNRRYMRSAMNAALKPSRHKIIEDSGPPQTPTPAVSVIIPTYDRPDFLEETVNSVFNQTFKDFELIVVNDGGPDGAGAIVDNVMKDRRHGARSAAPARHIKIEHGGISAALNAGVARARGELIAYLDDDDIYLPHHLETLVAYFKARPEARFAYTLSRRALQNRAGGEWTTVKKTLVNDFDYDREKLRSSNIIQTTGSIMHRRELLDDVGGFNENIIGSQDWEWYLRISGKYPLHCIKSPTVEHFIRRGRGAQLSGNLAVMRSNNMTVRYLRRLLCLTSNVPGARGYKRALRSIARLRRKWPEIIDILDVNELACRKPYACLYRLGRDLSAPGDREKARAAFVEAFKVAPWEIKVYSKTLFP